jgi:hypothetical protein
MKKETAQEKYDDALADGNSAVMVQENKADRDVLEINVGNILPGQEATITIQMLQSIEIEGGAYCLRIPLTYFPRYERE